jgi:hypothetical protein
MSYRIVAEPVGPIAGLLLVVVALAGVNLLIGGHPGPSARPSLPAVVGPSRQTVGPAPSFGLATSVLPSLLGRWRVDVVNGPRPVIVSIATDSEAWLWPIAAGERRTLLDEPVAHAGGIEVMGVVNGDPCTLLDHAFFPPESFTINLAGAPQGRDYTMTVTPGAPLGGPAFHIDFMDCSG